MQVEEGFVEGVAEGGGGGQEDAEHGEEGLRRRVVRMMDGCAWREWGDKEEHVQ